MTYSPKQIERLRKRNGWTQAELARRLGVCRSLVCHWEAGRRIPDGPALILLKQVGSVKV